jgi:hypothetical protein
MAFVSLLRSNRGQRRKQPRAAKMQPRTAPRGSVREMENEYYLQPLRCLFPGWFRRNN